MQPGINFNRWGLPGFPAPPPSQTVGDKATGPLLKLFDAKKKWPGSVIYRQFEGRAAIVGCAWPLNFGVQKPKKSATSRRRLPGWRTRQGA